MHDTKFTFLTMFIQFGSVCCAHPVGPQTQRLVLSEKTEHQMTTASRCLALAPPPRLPLSSGHLRGRWEPWYLSLDLAYFTWHAPKVHPCARARVLFLFGAE